MKHRTCEHDNDIIPNPNTISLGHICKRGYIEIALVYVSKIVAIVFTVS